jgi:hypothetical protein
MTGHTARTMTDLLRRHYLPENREPAGIFAPEIAAPGSNRRADLIWQGVTASGRELIGHEIKVTRADLLAELADPAKSDPWMRYCDRWYLVVPTLDLIEGLDLPAAWGLMTPPSGRRTRSMTVPIKAPKLNPDEQGPALRTLATWLHWRLHRTQTELVAEKRFIDRDRQELHDLRQQFAHRGHGVKSQIEELVEEVVRGIGVYSGRLGDGWRSDVKVEDVVAELKELGATRATTTDLRRQATGYRHQLKQIGDGATRLAAEIGEEAR